MPRPRSGIVWLTKPHVPPILQALAHGDVPLTHDGLARDRLVALLILLYAQPLPRIVRLTLADTSLTNSQVLLRLGDPAPKPPPFDQVLRDYVASRPNLTTATNPAGQWLFPGRRADQPIHPGSLRLRMNNLGIPILSSRTAAIRHLLRRRPLQLSVNGHGKPALLS